MTSSKSASVGSPGLPRAPQAGAWGSPTADFDGEHPIQNRDQRSKASDLTSSFLLSTHQMGREIRGRLGGRFGSRMGSFRGGGGALAHMAMEMVARG